MRGACCFGVGNSLRELRMKRQRVAAPPGAFALRPRPKYPLRGHQLGYRPKTNSYDAWSVPMWDQYIRDLAVFGTNAIELIPPRSDDAPDSPHFPLPQMPMMVEMSRIANDYGLGVWIWYPAMDADYSNPKRCRRRSPNGRTSSVSCRGSTPSLCPAAIRDIPIRDPLAVPRAADGQSASVPSARGDVGLAAELQPGMARLVLRLFEDERAELAERRCLRSAGSRLATRDAGGHSGEIPRSAATRTSRTRLKCQFPVQDWDTAFAMTESREVINPRPVAESESFGPGETRRSDSSRTPKGATMTSTSLSGAGWAGIPDRPVVETLREYGRYFISDEFADDFARDCWHSSELARAARRQCVRDDDAAAVPSLERRLRRPCLLNWRFQQALYRAYYDAFIYRRNLYETQLEQEALNRLSAASKVGSALAMQEAENDIGPGRRATGSLRACGLACLSWETCCFRAFACSSACHGTRRSASTAGRRSTRSTKRSTTACG